MSYSKYWVYKHQETYDNGVTWVDVTPSETVPSGSPLATYDTLAECEAHDYSLEYLTFVAEESGMYTFSGVSLDYSLDGGLTWSTLGENDSISVSSGDTVMWRGNYITRGFSGTFSSTNRFHVEGNIMSLVDGDDFIGKTSLASTQAFPFLFDRCAHLTSAENLILPATTLADECYYGMFEDCTSLTKAPSTLPATTLADWCYERMFLGCASLTTAPTLPATTLATMCYDMMFCKCSSLTTAPSLPATTLADWCYQDMFTDCTSLTTAPVLSATTLAKECYRQMFLVCTSLTTAPELPATTLAEGCYAAMFAGCSGLTTAPTLPATTLVDECYDNMFYLCTSLSSITCYATDISASDCTHNWVYKVASAGTFIKDCDTNWSSGNSGIPNGWNVTCDYSTKYLTFVAEEDGTFGFRPLESMNKVQYSTDNGSTWSTLAPGSTSITDYTPTISAGTKVLLKGTMTSNYGCCRFSSTGRFHVEGNIMSLYYGDNFVGQTSLSGKVGAFMSIFVDCGSNITSAENLILPATTLEEYCYYSMFSGCTSLTSAPELQATTLTPYCYQNMFRACSSLTAVTCLATDISASNCTRYWLRDASSSGTFTKAASMTSWSRDYNGIPSGWTVQDAT